MITVFLLAISLGMLTGLLPGLGVTALVLSMYHVISNFSIVEMFVFYSVLVSTTQYYGNISSIIYGTYGELTSAPAVRHGHALFLNNHQDGIKALVYTATSSLLASVFAILIMVWTFQNAQWLIGFLGNTAKVTILTLALIVLFLPTKNKLLALLSVAIAIVLGKIGYDTMFDTRILSGSESNFLDGGIPVIPVFVGLIVLPQLWKAYKENKKLKFINWNDISCLSRLKTLIDMPYKMSVLRGTVIGFITGLVPGISFYISSNLASGLEEKLSIKKNDSQKIRDFKCVISAEAANNSGSISVLIPLLVLALPIIPSEAVIMSMAERAGFGYSISYQFLTEQGTLLITTILLANLLNWIVSGFFYNFINKIFVVVKKYIYPVLFLVIISAVIQGASLNNQIFLSIVVMTIFTVIGYIMQDDRIKLLFVFSFFLSDSVVNEFYRFYLLNF